MEKKEEYAQKGSEKLQNRSSGEDKISRSMWIVWTLRRMDEKMEKKVISKKGHNWSLFSRLRLILLLKENKCSIVKA